MKKIVVLLVIAGMLISVGCDKEIKPLEQIKTKVSIPVKKIPVVIGMTLQRFLLSEEGKDARRVFYNHKSQIKQDLYVYEEQNFLFHDGILVDWQN